MTIHGAEVRAEEPLAGTRYRALRRISEGMSSEVFEAVGTNEERYAVKVLRGAYVGADDAVWRFTQEGRALAALDHPNLVRVLDVGVTPDGRPYFAMPRLTGETLRERLNRTGPLAPADACAFVLGTLEGLDTAHRAGIVHRDVKPANLFLVARSKTLGPIGVHSRRSTERCVLLDFGIAKIADAPGDPTTGTHVLGTPRYLAPEQILGGHVDARTDVYATGLVLFEAITGRRPYDAEDTREVMRAHLEMKPRRLRDFASVTSELDHTVARAIEKSPARRWPSARAFAAVLDRAAKCELRSEM